MDSQTWTNVLLGFLGLAVTLSLGVLTWSGTRRNSDRQEIAALRADRNKVESQGAIGRDYIEQLRKHIIDGNGAPPPPYPDGLYE